MNMHPPINALVTALPREKHNEAHCFVSLCKTMGPVSSCVYCIYFEPNNNIYFGQLFPLCISSRVQHSPIGCLQKIQWAHDERGDCKTPDNNINDKFYCFVS